MWWQTAGPADAGGPAREIPRPTARRSPAWCCPAGLARGAGGAVLAGWLMLASLLCAASRSALGMMELAVTSRLRWALRSAHPHRCPGRRCGGCRRWGSRLGWRRGGALQRVADQPPLAKKRGSGGAGGRAPGESRAPARGSHPSSGPAPARRWHAPAPAVSNSPLLRFTATFRPGGWKPRAPMVSRF